MKFGFAYVKVAREGCSELRIAHLYSFRRLNKLGQPTLFYTYPQQIPNPIASIFTFKLRDWRICVV